MPASLRALFDLCAFTDHIYAISDGRALCDAAFLPAGGLLLPDFTYCEDEADDAKRTAEPEYGLIRRGWLRLDAFGRCAMPEPVQALCLEALRFRIPDIQFFFARVLQLARRAAQRGDLRTRRTALRMLVRATPDILRFAPQPGDPDNCRRTAQPPDGGPENLLQSRWLTLLERAAETGSGAAAYAAAEMHRRGEGCRPDPEAWEDWLWKAAGEHSPEPSPSACYLLGRSCLETPKQIQIGFETETGLMLLQRAVALGCPELDEAGLAALREQYAPHHDPV